MTSTTTVRQLIASTINDNALGEISAADVRTVLNNILDSLDAIQPSVTKYGAVGNGTASDNAAFAAAEAAQSGYYVPPGTYRITANITLTKTITFAPGAVLYPSSGVTITLNGEIIAGFWRIFEVGLGGTIAGPVRNQYVYPDWWGAGPGVNINQSPAIQHAINFAQNGGRTVYLRSGLWRCDNTLFMTEPAGIIGDPGNAAQSVTAAQSALDFSNAAGDVSGIQLGRSVDFPLDGCIVRDIAIHRTVLPTRNGGATGLRLKSCTQAEIINVMCWNWDRGFVIFGSATYPSGQCHFSGCRSQYAGMFHFDIWSAIDCVFDRCSAGGGNADYCVYIYPNAGAVSPNALHFTNCIFVSNTNLEGVRILTGFWHNFENCVFEELLNNGIMAVLPAQDLSILNISVIDCWFNNCGSCFASTGVGGNFRIENNRMEVPSRAGTAGVVLDSTDPGSPERDVTIQGNVIKVNGSSQSGISLQRISGANVFGNRLYMVGSAAARPGIILGSLCQASMVSFNRSYTTHPDPGGISNNGPNNLLVNNVKP